MFLHAVGFGIVTAAVMALAAVGFTAELSDWLDPGSYMTHNPRHGR
jgi:hypothetical protein